MNKDTTIHDELVVLLRKRMDNKRRTLPEISNQMKDYTSPEILNVLIESPDFKSRRVATFYDRSIYCWFLASKKLLNPYNNLYVLVDCDTSAKTLQYLIEENIICFKRGYSSQGHIACCEDMTSSKLNLGTSPSIYDTPSVAGSIILDVYDLLAKNDEATCLIVGEDAIPDSLASELKIRYPKANIVWVPDDYPETIDEHISCYS